MQWTWGGLSSVYVKYELAGYKNNEMQEINVRQILSPNALFSSFNIHSVSGTSVFLVAITHYLISKAVHQLCNGCDVASAISVVDDLQGINHEQLNNYITM